MPTPPEEVMRLAHAVKRVFGGTGWTIRPDNEEDWEVWGMAPRPRSMRQIKEEVEEILRERDKLTRNARTQATKARNKKYRELGLDPFEVERFYLDCYGMGDYELKVNFEARFGPIKTKGSPGRRPPRTGRGAVS